MSGGEEPFSLTAGAPSVGIGAWDLRVEFCFIMVSVIDVDRWERWQKVQSWNNINLWLLTRSLLFWSYGHLTSCRVTLTSQLGMTRINRRAEKYIKIIRTSS